MLEQMEFISRAWMLSPYQKKRQLIQWPSTNTNQQFSFYLPLLLQKTQASLADYSNQCLRLLQASNY